MACVVSASSASPFTHEKQLRLKRLTEGIDEMNTGNEMSSTLLISRPPEVSAGSINDTQTECWRCCSRPPGQLRQTVRGPLHSCKWERLAEHIEALAKKNSASKEPEVDVGQSWWQEIGAPNNVPCSVKTTSMLGRISLNRLTLACSCTRFAWFTTVSSHLLLLISRPIMFS